MRQFEIVSINISKKKGVVKTPVSNVRLIQDFGIEGDAHGETPGKQVSLLALEDIEYMQKKLNSIKPGDFAENITTKGIELYTLPVGSLLKIGEVELKITKIGKECHHGCEIKQKTGECIMPKRGIFAEVLNGGTIFTGIKGILFN